MGNNEFKKICIKNRTCCYFEDIIKSYDFNLDNILLAKKSHQNILVYSLSCKSLINPKPLHIRFDKIDRFMRI